MKFYHSQLFKLIDSIKNENISAILLYGNNRGSINIIIKEIVKTLSLPVREISNKSTSLAELKFVANNMNFFSNKELIKIIVNSDLTAEVQNWISKDKTSNIICFCYYDITPGGNVRQLFEKSNNLAVIKCYFEEKNTVISLLLREAQKYKKKITKNALEIIQNCLIGDQQMILNEIEKLFLYTHDRDVISEYEVMDVIGSNLLIIYDDLCFFFASGQSEKFLNELDKFRNNNISDIQILRALTKYYVNLYIVISKTELGSDVDGSMKLLSPPIFFKYVDNFKKILSSLSIEKVTQILELLYQAEIDLKRYNQNIDIFTNLYSVLFTDDNKSTN